MERPILGQNSIEFIQPGSFIKTLLGSVEATLGCLMWSLYKIPRQVTKVDASRPAESGRDSGPYYNPCAAEHRNSSWTFGLVILDPIFSCPAKTGGRSPNQTPP